MSIEEAERRLTEAHNNTEEKIQFLRKVDALFMPFLASLKGALGKNADHLTLTSQAEFLKMIHSATAAPANRKRTAKEMANHQTLIESSDTLQQLYGLRKTAEEGVAAARVAEQNAEEELTAARQSMSPKAEGGRRTKRNRNRKQRTRRTRK
jgi:hypothetical protein